MRRAWQYVAVAVAVISYSSFYYVCRKWLAKDRIPEFSCRIVTLAHAVSSVLLSAYCCFKVGPFPFTTSDAALTPIQAMALASSLGYFLFDSTWCLYHNTEGIVMLSHHVVSIATLGRAVHVGKNGTEYLAGVGLLEITNPILQIRWFLRSLGYHNRIPFYVVDWIFITEYTLIRMVYGTYMLTRMWELEGSMKEYRYFFVSIYIISCLFFFGIIRYVWRKYIKKNEDATLTESPAQQQQENVIVTES